jgi:HEPN domain-containing protein
MAANERVIAVVRGWIEKAENDLKNAVITLRAGEECPADTVAFHAQQCAEKYLKAYLAYRETEFPKIHDVGELLALAAPGIPVPLSVEEQRRLTSYGTLTRYPGDYEPVSLDEAKRAVAMARRVRRSVRQGLPPEVLRRRKS